MPVTHIKSLPGFCCVFFWVMLLGGYPAAVIPDDTQLPVSSLRTYPSIDEKIARYVDLNPGVSVSVALVNGESVEWLANYPADFSGKRIYRAGSLAKVLTALAIMKLQDQEVLDIDQPLSAYLPRFAVKRRFSDVNPVTLRHLLNHHSGLPTNIIKGQWSHVHFSTVVEQLRNEYLSYPPDFVHSYSNIGYVLLGLVIEEVSGQSYESYIRENIFQPLGMQDSGFDYPGSNHVNFVSPHLSNREALLPIRDVPAMGLYTTADDMARLIALLVNNGSYNGKEVIHPSVIELMMERTNEDVTLDYDHQDGLGLLLNHCVFDYHADVIEHGGHTMYYSSHFVGVPEFNLGAIVLSNSRAAKKFVHQLARDMVSASLDKHYPKDKKLPAAHGKIVLTDKGKTIDKKTGEVSGVKYLTKTGLLTLQLDESDMCACQDDKRLDLLPLPDGWYRIANRKKQASARDIELASQQIDGQSVLAMRKDGLQQRLGEYVPEQDIPDSWKRRIGQYRVENPDAEFPFEDVSLIEQGNLLYLSYRMPMLSNKQVDLPLAVLDDRQAITMGLGRGRGETVLAEQTAEGEYLLYSGYLVKRIGG